MHEIDSVERLESWIRDHRPATSGILASRIALRVLPLLFDNNQNISNKRFDWILLSLFRVHVVEQAARSRRYDKLSQDALWRACNCCDTALFALTDVTVRAVTSSTLSAFRPGYSGLEISRVVISAIRAGQAVTPPLTEHETWKAISEDCKFGAKLLRQPASMLSLPLWQDDVPQTISVRLNEFGKRGIEAQKWAQWRLWYDLRLKGRRRLWNLPPDGEKEIAKLLVEAGDEFWALGLDAPEIINERIDEWIQKYSKDSIDISSSLEITNENQELFLNETPSIPLPELASRFASPNIILNSSNKFAALPNVNSDSARDPASLSELIRQNLLLIPPTHASLGRNTPVILRANLRFYKTELKSNRELACWGSLDRLISNAKLSYTACESDMFSAGIGEQIEQIFALHERCMEALVRPKGVNEAIEKINIERPEAAEIIEKASNAIASGVEQIVQSGASVKSFNQNLQIIVISGRENSVSITQGKGNEYQRNKTTRKWVFGTLGVALQTLAILGSLTSIAPFVMPKEQLDAAMKYFQEAVANLLKFGT